MRMLGLLMVGALIGLVIYVGLVVLAVNSDDDERDYGVHDPGERP